MIPSQGLITPCTPSPCGANAVCKEQNGAGSCTCLPDYFGNPYEGCRPECLQNSDCPSFLSCVQNKCRDPCPGACAPNTDCTAINHMPSCTCRTGYTGNPFSFCSIVIQSRKSTIVFYSVSLVIMGSRQVGHDLSVRFASSLQLVRKNFQKRTMLTAIIHIFYV